MTSTDRLSAAQTARAAAKRAFNTAVSAATAAAIARGLRSVEAIDAAVEADERVIAARAASAKAAEELTAAEAAVRADASVSQEDRMHAMTQGAHAMARTHVEHDPATIYDPAAGTEAQSVTSTAPSAPLSHSETIAAAAVPAAYCEPGEDVSTCARRAFGAGVVVDTMMRGAQGRTLVGAVATRRTGPHFAVYAAEIAANT